MIRVRPTKPTPEFIKAGVDELKKYRANERARKAAARDDKKKKVRMKPFKFTVYGGAREQLTNLFHGKCSYCEADFESVMPGDVEHFRPKGGVLVDNELKPGYHWLAAAWNNLLISCADCNRKRKQRIKGVKGRIPVGKLNQFPLVDESRRARRPCDVAREKPLLLNPYIDYPERYLAYEFDDEGDVLVKPSKKSGLARRKAETSIEVYAMLRSGLVHSRTRIAKRIQMDISRLRDFQAQLALRPDDAWLEGRFLQDIELLKTNYTEDEKPYAAMARYLINPVIDELTGYIRKRKGNARSRRIGQTRKRLRK